MERDLWRQVSSVLLPRLCKVLIFQRICNIWTSLHQRHTALCFSSYLWAIGGTAWHEASISGVLETLKPSKMWMSGCNSTTGRQHHGGKLLKKKMHHQGIGGIKQHLLTRASKPPWAWDGFFSLSLLNLCNPQRSEFGNRRQNARKHLETSPSLKQVLPLLLVQRCHHLVPPDNAFSGKHCDEWIGGRTHLLGARSLHVASGSQRLWSVLLRGREQRLRWGFP